MFLIRLLIPIFFLAGCSQAALLVQQQKITSKYLASTNVGSPDPRTSPNGQMILAEWWVPKTLLATSPKLKLEIIYKDLSQEVVEFSIGTRVGYETFSVLNDQFKETGGFLAYRADIITDEGEIYTSWEHQLWFRLIDMGEGTSEPMSSLVDSKSKQESVTETPSLRLSSKG